MSLTISNLGPIQIDDLEMNGVIIVSVDFCECSSMCFNVLHLRQHADLVVHVGTLTVFYGDIRLR